MTNETNKQIYDKFIEWLALSDEEKINGGFPLTQKEFAIRHGKTEATLSIWKQRAASGELEYGTGFQLDDGETVDKALLSACKTGNAQALRIYYQITNRLVDKKEETHRFELTPDERINIAIQLRDAIIGEFRDTGNCPICGFTKAICDRIRVGTEPEQSEDREVGTVAVPIRSD